MEEVKVETVQDLINFLSNLSEDKKGAKLLTVNLEEHDLVLRIEQQGETVVIIND